MKKWMLFLALAASAVLFAGPQASSAYALHGWYHGRPVYRYTVRSYAYPAYYGPVIAPAPVVVGPPVVVARPAFAPVYAPRYYGPGFYAPGYYAPGYVGGYGFGYGW